VFLTELDELVAFERVQRWRIVDDVGRSHYDTVTPKTKERMKSRSLPGAVSTVRGHLTLRFPSAICHLTRTVAPRTPRQWLRHFEAMVLETSKGTQYTPTARSSLLNHTIPAFYACYLLKSRKTERATGTYIGSTPDPPRRIRQHNGEIVGGAKQTRNGRPWEMVRLNFATIT